MRWARRVEFLGRLHTQGGGPAASQLPESQFPRRASNNASVSFKAFSEDPLATLISSAGDSTRLSLVVGAGASMEAGLLSWEQLVASLLRRAVQSRGLFDTSDADAMRRWETEAARDGPLGAAAIFEALTDEDVRDQWIHDALFSEGTPGDFAPGAISRQIPRLYEAFGDRLRVMTMNYDDLVEQAFRESEVAEPVALATADQRHPGGTFPIHHLHGYFGRDDGPRGDIVLSEADYQRMQQRSAWQEDLVRTALRDSTVVFVGTSMVDPNLIRYLHGVEQGASAACFAVFVRQGSYGVEVPPAGIPEAREEALRARWQALGVTPVFVDHFVDVAQVLHEIARRRQLGSGYVALPERARGWVDTVRRDILGAEEAERFSRTQRTLVNELQASLDAAVSAAETLGAGEWGEKLALSLWLVDADGEHLTNWATTDRIHLDPDTVEPVPISEHARWVAVRSYCHGTALGESRDVYASRWHFIKGMPLVVESDMHGRIPIGCLTVASRLGKHETALNTMEDIVEAGFNRALARSVLALLDQPFDGGTIRTVV